MSMARGCVVRSVPPTNDAATPQPYDPVPVRALQVQGGSVYTQNNSRFEGEMQLVHAHWEVAGGAGVYGGLQMEGASVLSLGRTGSVDVSETADVGPGSALWCEVGAGPRTLLHAGEGGIRGKFTMPFSQALAAAGMGVKQSARMIEIGRLVDLATTQRSAHEPVHAVPPTAANAAASR